MHWDTTDNETDKVLLSGSLRSRGEKVTKQVNTISKMINNYQMGE